MEVKSGCTLLKNGLFENGHICSIGADGIDIWAAGKPMYNHYTEALNTMVNSDKYFAVDPKEECPRLVELIAGDEWMTDIDYENDPKYAEIKDELMKHIVKLTKTNAQSKDDWYGVDTLADGTKAFHYMYLG